MPSNQKQGSSATVLVVEDEIAIRIAVAAYLRDCGYRVFEAVSGDEAIVVLQEPDLHVDIVFSDVEMPGVLDGFGLRQWAAQARPELRVILAGTPQRAVEKAGGLCDETPLPKPYDHQVVAHRIQRMLSARTGAGRSLVQRTS